MLLSICANAICKEVNQYGIMVSILHVLLYR